MKCSKELFLELYRKVETGEITQKQAAKIADYTTVQFSNLFKLYRIDGDKIFTHGLAEKKSNRAIPEEKKIKIQTLYKEKYPNYKLSSFLKIISDIPELKCSIKTLKKILSEENVDPLEKSSVEAVERQIEEIDEPKSYEEKIYQFLKYYSKKEVDSDSIAQRLCISKQEFLEINRIVHKNKIAPSVDNFTEDTGKLISDTMASIKNLREEIKKDENLTLFEKKKKYIPLVSNGTFSHYIIGEYLNMPPVYLAQLAQRYKSEGESCFIRKPSARTVGNHVIPKDEVEKIITLYSDKYQGIPFGQYCEILKRDYKINHSSKAISKYLVDAGFESPDKNQHLRCHNAKYEDFEMYLSKLKFFISENNNSESMEYGIIYCCNLLFDSCWRTLKKVLSKKGYNKENFRTSFSIFELALSQNIIDTRIGWEHWKKYHQYFSYPYEPTLRKNSIKYIEEIYYPMFENILYKIKLDEEEREDA